MREIKFAGQFVYRIWCSNDKLMLYTYDELEEFAKANNETIQDVKNCIFTDTEAQRSTGLKDKNGKMIYEGDILRFTEVDEDSALGAEETYTTQVKWIDDLAQWRVVFPSGRRSELHCILQIPCFYNQEIIGNISENPELLA